MSFALVYSEGSAIKTPLPRLFEAWGKSLAHAWSGTHDLSQWAESARMGERREAKPSQKMRPSAVGRQLHAPRDPYGHTGTATSE